MSPITPVKYTTPDGVERDLRYTFGAQKRIVERLGCPISAALTRFENAAIPDILYACMYDEQGRPPKDLDPVVFAESADPAEAEAMLAAFMSAVHKGRKSKNEILALMKEEKEQRLSLMRSFGSPLGALLEDVSDSPVPSSGTSQNGSSTPSGSSSETSSANSGNALA